MRKFVRNVEPIYIYIYIYISIDCIYSFVRPLAGGFAKQTHVDENVLIDGWLGLSKAYVDEIILIDVPSAVHIYIDCISAP